jgi:hypothetical protein
LEGKIKMKKAMLFIFLVTTVLIAREDKYVIVLSDGSTIIGTFVKLDNVTKTITLTDSTGKEFTLNTKDIKSQQLIESTGNQTMPMQPKVKAENTPGSLVGNSRKYRIELSLGGGEGLKKIDIGYTNKNETINISPGGGFGGNLGFGYYMSPLFDVDLEIGSKESSLSRKVENADGSFRRSFFLGTLRYRIPVTGKSSINIGGGAGAYTAGKLDLDLSKVADGAHIIFKYKNAIGIHVFGEYEHGIPRWSFLNAGWSWSAGLRYYNISYKLDSIEFNGISIPAGVLPADLPGDFTKLNGSGFDFLLSIILHL